MRMRSLISFVSSLLKNLLFSYIVSFLLILLFSLIMQKCKFSFSVVSAGILIIYFLSCFLGGFLIGKQQKEKKFLWGFCLGGCYFLVLLALSFFLNHTLQNDMPGFLTACLLCMGSGTLGGMLS